MVNCYSIPFVGISEVPLFVLFLIKFNFLIFSNSFEEQNFSPEEFAETLCQDLDYPDIFQTPVAASIRKQLRDYAEVQRKYKERLQLIQTELSNGTLELLYLIRVNGFYSVLLYHLLNR